MTKFTKVADGTVWEQQMSGLRNHYLLKNVETGKVTYVTGRELVTEYKEVK